MPRYDAERRSVVDRAGIRLHGWPRVHPLQASYPQSFISMFCRLRKACGSGYWLEVVHGTPVVLQSNFLQAAETLLLRGCLRDVFSSRKKPPVP